MTTHKEALKLEFDALFAEHQKLLGELQAMRAVAKPEPVGEAYLCDECQTPFDGAFQCPSCGHGRATKEPVYTTPPQRTWVGLTDEDKKEYVSQDFGGNRLDAMDWAEKRLKEKNT